MGQIFMPRIANLLFVGGVCVICSMFVIGAGTSEQESDTKVGTHPAEAVRMTLASGAETGVSKPEPDVEPRHGVIIRKPTGPPRIELAGTDPQGRSGSVACSTCHSIRKPNFANVSPAALDEFHRGMVFDHGKIACYACHNPDDSDSLRLADGNSVAYEDVMKLCSQCHGQQATAFAHGAHGGMNGHWDLSRGPQLKNNCVDCHDPHVPAYPKMVVGFKPKDRFNAPHGDQHEPTGADSHGDH
jgi:hypothetical protein